MNTKTIGNVSAQLLEGLHREGKDFFQTSDATRLLPGRGETAIRRLLSEMTKRGLLMRLREGLYHIVPYDSDPARYFPDWHVAAHYLAGKTPYYIGYFSALALHDLTTQPSLSEQVVVSKPVRPAKQIIKGIPFHFIVHSEQHFFGIARKWVSGIYQINCSDLEKTLIDCAFKPVFAGGVVEIAKAMFNAKDVIEANRLLNYAGQFGSDAVLRRLGFLMETISIQPELVQEIQRLLPKSGAYVALDTALPKTGKALQRWGIVQNVDTETIQTAMFT